MKEPRQEHQRNFEAKGNPSVCKGSQENAIKGRGKECGQEQTLVVSFTMRRGKVMRPSSLVPKPQTHSDGKIHLEEKFSVTGVRLGRDLEDRAKTTSLESARIM